MRYQSKLSFFIPVCGIILTAVGLFGVVYGLVEYIETNEICVVGNIDMWVGFIGALIGGIFTMLGVMLTLKFQNSSDEEKIRLENMPILKFKISYGAITDYDMDGIFTLNGNDVLTTDFPTDENKEYPIISVELANDKPAFDVYLESAITIEHKTDVRRHPCYAPAKYRLVSDENISYMFWIKDYGQYSSANVLGLMRISYSDLFGYKYYQDMEFSYDEIVVNGEKFKLDNIMSPVLQRKCKRLYAIMKKQMSAYLSTSSTSEKKSR